jgi:hypothetical protein
LAGHSVSPLAKKLGIRDGQKVAILNPPAGYAVALGDLPPKTVLARGLSEGLDLIQYFVSDPDTLAREFRGLKASINAGGAIWVSWPKASSGLGSGLKDTVVREIGLKNGLVDVKVCAIDGTWSALKFVVRRPVTVDGGKHRGLGRRPPRADHTQEWF